MRRPAWFLGLLALLLLALLTSISAARTPKKKRSSAKAKVRTLRQRLNRIRGQAGSKRQELRATKQSQHRISDQLQASYQRLEEAQHDLDAARRRLRRVRTALKDSTRRLQAAQERFDQQQGRMAARIGSQYREGPVSFLKILLTARSLGDYLDRDYYMRRILSRDGRLLDGLRLAKRQLEAERLRWMELHVQANEAAEDQAGRLAMVQAQAYEREQLLDRIKGERALQEQQLAELEQDSIEIQRSLQAELARRAALQRAAGSRYKKLPAWSGRWRMPVVGRITSGYGYRMHPILRRRRLHTGLDITAKKGTIVRAAAAGEVFYAAWRGGYGRCIIVLHGNGYSTLYGHLSSLAVHKGQKVKTGEVIGRVGSTGLSTGPHLHFEVRRQGVPINPR